MPVELHAKRRRIESGIAQAVDQARDRGRVDPAGMVLEQTVEPSLANQRREGVHIADIDQNGALVVRCVAHRRVAQRAHDRRSSRIHQPGARPGLLHARHARHPVRRRVEDHGLQPAPISNQRLKIVETDIVVAQSGTIPVILHGNCRCFRQFDTEQTEPRSQSGRIDIGQFDDTRISRSILAQFDAHRFDPCQIVVHGAGCAR